MKDLKQMELIPSTSSLEDTLANLSPSQVEKKVKKIRDTSGQSILDLSKNSDRLGLLEKMLVDTLNSVSTPLSRTWRVKTTPLGRLVFQLRASVPTTKEKESGYWLTPNAMDSLPPRSKEALKKQYQTNRKGRTTHSTLREQVVYPKPNQMWRTPDAHSGRGPSSEERMKMKLDKKMPISLNDQVAHPGLMWPTPKASGQEKLKTLIKRKGIKEAVKHNLTAAVEMWPTPSQRDYKGGSGTIKEKDGKYYRQSDKTGTKYGVRLDALIEYQHRKMYPTPAAHEGRLGYQRRDTGKKGTQKSLTTIVIDDEGGREKTTGQLNPTWVEWLMGYPSGWTDLNHSETVSSLKSPTTSDQSSSKRWPTPTSTDGQRGDVNNLDGYRRRRDKWAAKGVNIHKPLDVAVALEEEEKKMWRTPTAIDGGDKAEKYAARILLGKNKRSSKHKVQETLSMQVAMEELKDDPQRVEELMKEEMVTRPQLPEQKEFVEYMHSQTTPRKLSDQSGIDYTTVEHWFRRGGSFSYPSVKDWNHIKQFLQEIKFDKEITTTETIEWKN